MYLYCGLVCRIFFKKNSNNPSLVYFGERVKVNDEFIKRSMVVKTIITVTIKFENKICSKNVQWA